MARRDLVSVEGGALLVKNLRQFGINVEKELEQLVSVTALAIEGEAKRSIQKSPASGKTYKKASPKRTHVASSPGNPPRTDTGALAASITHVIEGTNAAVGTGLQYGVWLEFGTQNMAARPFLYPALFAQERKFEKALNAIVDAAAKGVA
nr:hypothetical protein [uncultured Roseateles sp.]